MQSSYSCSRAQAALAMLATQLVSCVRNSRARRSRPPLGLHLHPASCMAGRSGGPRLL